MGVVFWSKKILPNMKLLIVAENKNIRQIYRKLIEPVLGLTSVLDCSSAEEALFLIFDNNIDLVVTEVNLPGRSGLDLATTLMNAKIDCLFIVLSDNDEFVIRAIRAQVFDYIVKPLKPQQLKSVTEKAVEKISLFKSNQYHIRNKTQKVRINTANGFVMIDINKLIYCKADGAYSNLFLSDGVELYSSYNIGRIEEILTNFKFVRVNRSILLNVRVLKRIEKYKHLCVIDTINGELQLPISKQYITRIEGNSK
jgi:two-component system, LytTR family, response regulator